MILLDKNRIQRTLQRMSFQIVEEARGMEISLIGLNEGGAGIAKQIQPDIEEATSQKVPLYSLSTLNDTPFTLPEQMNGSRILVMIDDVIFSGETMHRALNKVEDISQFEKIYIAVLVDRGHRKFPLHAGIVGLNVPTKLNEEVELKLKEGKPEKVILIQN